VNSITRTEFRVDLKVGVLVYKLSRYQLKIVSYLSIIFVAYLFATRITCCETDCTIFCPQTSKTLKEDNSNALEHFLFVPSYSRDGVWEFLTASDRNHANTSNNMRHKQKQQKKSFLINIYSYIMYFSYALHIGIFIYKKVSIALTIKYLSYRSLNEAVSVTLIPFRLKNSVLTFWTLVYFLSGKSTAMWIFWP